MFRRAEKKLLEYLPRGGDLSLDAASWPIQYPEYLDYSRGFSKRVCVDISQRALDLAREKLGERGEYTRASILELPFPDNHFDAMSLTISISQRTRGAVQASVATWVLSSSIALWRGSRS